MSRALSKSRPVPRRGLCREEAAVYLGISPNTFDELRKLGRVDSPRVIGGRKLWDIHDLDMAFDSLPRENAQTMGQSWEP